MRGVPQRRGKIERIAVLPQACTAAEPAVVADGGADGLLKRREQLDRSGLGREPVELRVFVHAEAAPGAAEKQDVVRPPHRVENIVDARREQFGCFAGGDVVDVDARLFAALRREGLAGVEDRGAVRAEPRRACGKRFACDARQLIRLFVVEEQRAAALVREARAVQVKRQLVEHLVVLFGLLLLEQRGLCLALQKGGFRKAHVPVGAQQIEPVRRLGLRHGRERNRKRRGRLAAVRADAVECGAVLAGLALFGERRIAVRGEEQRLRVVPEEGARFAVRRQAAGSAVFRQQPEIAAVAVLFGVGLGAAESGGFAFRRKGQVGEKPVFHKGVCGERFHCHLSFQRISRAAAGDARGVTAIVQRRKRELQARRRENRRNFQRIPPCIRGGFQI